MPKQVWPNDKRNSIESGSAMDLKTSTQWYPNPSLSPQLHQHSTKIPDRGRFPVFNIAPFSQALTGVNVFTDSGESSNQGGGTRHRNFRFPKRTGKGISPDSACLGSDVLRYQFDLADLIWVWSVFGLRLRFLSS